jgi:hypothetical protein
LNSGYQGGETAVGDRNVNDGAQRFGGGSSVGSAVGSSAISSSAGTAVGSAVGSAGSASLPPQAARKRVKTSNKTSIFRFFMVFFYSICGHKKLK